MVAVANFFDTIGVLVDEGLLVCRTCFDLFGDSEEHYFKAYKPIMDDPNHKDNFKYFLRLHNSFMKERAALQKSKRRLAL